MTLQEFIEILRARGLEPKQLPSGQWMALCPGHNDTEPSLSIAESEGGRILLHCFAGCDFDAICLALGLKPGDLTGNEGGSQPREGLTLKQLADVKKLPIEFLSRLGWRDNGGRVAIPFNRPDGSKVFQFRHSLDKTKGSERYTWTKGVKASEVVYGVDALPPDATEVWVTESALDAATLQFVGIPAIAVAGQANSRAVAGFADKLAHIPTIMVWQEPDAPNFAQKVATAVGRSVLCVQPSGSEPKDANRLWLEVEADKAKFLERLQQLRERAITVEPQLCDQTLAKQVEIDEGCPFCPLSDDELKQIATPILHSPNPLETAVALIEQATGIVAEQKRLRLLLLLTTTRIFDQPLHAYIVAPTGAGKSALANAVTKALPPCQVQRLVGASALSLLAHNLKAGSLIEWKEAPHHWHENSLSASVLRTVLWQNEGETGEYLTIEYTNRKGYRKIRWRLPKRLGFVMTATEPPKDPQLRTRVWLIEVEETLERRIAVLTAIAQRFTQDGSQPPVSLAALQAFNELIARKRVKVRIPFAPFLASWLAQTLPTTRDFRDFIGLLELVAAAAVWNMERRKQVVAEDGALVIEATVDDYKVVWELVQDAWKADRAEVTEAQKRIYDVVANWTGGTQPTCADIARALKVTDEAVRKSLKALTAKGYIEAIEGRPQRFRVVREIEQTTILPSPDIIASSLQQQTDQPSASQPNEANLTTICQLGVGWQKNPTNTGTSDHFQLSNLSFHIFRVDEPTSESSVVDPFANQTTDECSKVEVGKLENTKTPANTGQTSPTTPKLAMVGKVGFESPKSPTSLSPFAETSQFEWFKCPRCGLRRLMSPDSWLLGGKCPECGADMQPEDPDGSPPTQPTDLEDFEPEPDFATDEPMVDTLQWLAENIGFASTDSGDQVSAKDQPLESDQTFESVPISAKDQPLESDQPPKGRAVPPLSCGEMANELLAILRNFQRSSPTHRKCLTEPCSACRERVRRIRWLEREQSRHGLWLLLQRARQWQGGDAA